MSLNKVPRPLLNETGLNAHTLQGKEPTNFADKDHHHSGTYLPINHASARFSYDGTDGRIKVDGNDAKVLRSIHTEQWNGIKVWRGTQTEFDRISPKDANTLYLVKKG